MIQNRLSGFLGAAWGAILAVCSAFAMAAGHGLYFPAALVSAPFGVFGVLTALAGSVILWASLAALARRRINAVLLSFHYLGIGVVAITTPDLWDFGRVRFAQGSVRVAAYVAVAFYLLGQALIVSRTARAFRGRRSGDAAPTPRAEHNNGIAGLRSGSVRTAIAIAIAAIAAGAAMALGRQPILAQTPGEWGCACGDMFIKTTRWVAWNPLRDHAPEKAANAFLVDLRNNECSAVHDICQYALPAHRVSDWRLAYREDAGGAVSLYFKLTKYGGGPGYNLTGVGAVALQKAATGWTVAGYDSYF